MKFRNLKINCEVTYYGKRYIVWNITPPNVEMKRYDDGEIITVNFYELVKNPSFKPTDSFVKKKEGFIYKSTLDEISEKNRDKAIKRYEIIRPVIILRKIKSHDLRAAYEFSQIYSEFIFDGEDI